MVDLIGTEGGIEVCIDLILVIPYLPNQCSKPFQITTLVNFKEGYLSGGKKRSEKALRSALKVIFFVFDSGNLNTHMLKVKGPVNNILGMDRLS